jgi:stage V sporulation protein D (sporulation-specific penicillin-binding protein)
LKERPSGETKASGDAIISLAGKSANLGLKKNEDKHSFFSFRKRGWIIFVGLVATLLAGYLVTQLYDLQINKYLEYSQAASKMHWKRIKDIPLRGDILDANGNILASTTYEYTVGITPKDILSDNSKVTAEAVAQQMADILHIDYSFVYESMLKTDATYIQLAKKIAKQDIDLLKDYLSENKLGGVKIDAVPKRYYVYGDLASQIIGFADHDDTTLVGQYGIEAYYNDLLSGQEGYTYVEVDNYSSGALPYSPPTTIERIDGYNVVLNIDMNIQKIAEEACKEAYDVYNPKEGVTAIVMNPYTGAIYANVSIPDFDLNDPRGIPFSMDELIWESYTNEEQMNYLMSNVWRNRAISDTYEPGSTFKVLTTAIALEEGMTYEDEMFSDKPIEVSEIDTISCWREDEGGNHGTETLRQAFENSCNPIFVQLAARIGLQKFYEYVRNFGFYNYTGVDLPAEGKGIFHANPDSVDLATLSFGESSTVTPLQLANVYCALVNGGTLMTPQVAKYLTDDSGNIIKEFSPVKVKTIFSELTANRVKELMKNVVTEGTGSAGYVEGYNVAGKTSTSTIETGEDKGLHVLSFGCYAPSDNPEIVVLVLINKPEDKELGSSAATRVAAKIVSETLEYMDVKRKLTEKDYERLTTKYTVPTVERLSHKEAKKTLYTAGYTVVDGEDNMTDEDLITFVYPSKETILYRSGIVVLYSSATPDEASMKKVIVPDFTGKNISECYREAQDALVNISIKGNPEGVVVSQSPSSGYVEIDNETDSGEGEDISDETNATDTAVMPEDSSPERIQVAAGTVIILTME